MSYKTNISDIELDGNPFSDGESQLMLESGKIEKYSPVDGALIGSITNGSKEIVDYAVDVARKSFADCRWRGMPLSARKQILMRLSELIRNNSHELALMDTVSMGKPLAQCMENDIPKSIDCLEWFAESIDKIYDYCTPAHPSSTGFITREPIGVVAAITPWNYPMENIAWKVSPALAAGNSVILKPSEEATYSAVKFAKLAKEAGIPDGVLNVIPGEGNLTGRLLSIHDNVDMVSFTGSTSVGKKILQYSSESNMKRVSLECGGKSSFIVLDDAYDLDAAAKTLSENIFINNGQTCSAPSRLIIQSSVHDVFMDKLIKYSRTYTPNNPLLKETVIGAVVNKEQLSKIEHYVDQGVKSGASIVLGGKTAEPVKGGFYFSPTIFDQVDNDSVIARDEIFGPVLTVQTCDDYEEAVKISNDSKYGLAASIWTSNFNKAHTVARSLYVGTVHINSYGDDDITAPFGGYKQSGNGYKEKSLFAIDTYTNKKTTWFNV